jgi:hypothetical protein
MKKFLPLLFLGCFCHFICLAQITKFETSKGTQTPTYAEVIAWWQKFDQQYGQVKMLTKGMTDAGKPLHLVVISTDKDFNFESLHKKNKRIILINNGIHPGEPDGIDASMLLARDIVTGKEKLPDNIVLAIIPVYNIGGALNRSKNYRVDQNGPEEFGFRGNARNYDLNRDFIKNDSRNAQSFVAIFHEVDPDVFLDNHVSNGADYQHIMTLIASQHNKLGGPMGEFMNKEFEPGMYSLMKEKGYDLIPYVNSFGDTPENGWPEFWDSPRYSSGYASLWHTFGFISETHMLKPYDKRVMATYALMKSFIEFTNQHSASIKKLREETKNAVKTQKEFTASWKLDTTKKSERIYKGFTSGRKPSEISGLPRLFYDRSKPYEIKVPFYNFYQPEKIIQKPTAYIIPQGWWPVIDLLKLNGVKMTQLKNDSAINVEVYKIENYQSSTRPYEGHHPNSKVEISTSLQKIHFRKGDYFIAMNQEANRFLMEVLEPQMEDSYFTWNFFDPILSQKEGFSSYVFEETATAYLKQHPEIKKQLEDKRNSDSVFAKSASAQLNFVFQHSPYYEPDHLRYPVYRVR